MMLTEWAGLLSPRGKRREATWEELEILLSVPVELAEKNSAPGVAPVTFRDDTRSKANVEAVHALVFDLDHNGVDDACKALEGTTIIVHSTYSSTAEKPRCRAWLRLSRSVTADEHARLWIVVANRLLDGDCEPDSSARDASRLNFVPSIPIGGSFAFRSLAGSPLDVSALLSATVERRPASSAWGTAALAGICDRIARAQAGERDSDLTRGCRKVGGIVAGGSLDSGAARARLLAACSSWGPVSAGDAAKVDRWLRYGSLSPLYPPDRNDRNTSNSTTVTGADGMPDGMPDGMRATSEPVLWTAADMAGEPPLPSYVVERLHLAPGRPFALTGYAGTCKSLLMSDLLLGVASGVGAEGEIPTCWGGLEIQRSGRVVHLDLEVGKAGTWRRYAALARGRGFDVATLGDRFRWRSYGPWRLNAVGALDALCRMIDGSVVCLIDSLKASLPGVKENEAAIADFVGLLGEGSEKTGCAISLIHHEGKPPEEGKRSAEYRGRGSSAIQGCLSSQWSASLAEGGVLIEHGKSEHDERLPPLRAQLRKVRVDGHDGLVWTPVEAPALVSVEDLRAAWEADRAAVLEAIRNQQWDAMGGCPGVGVLAAALGRRQADVRLVWTDLAKRGEIVNVSGKGGKYARWRAPETRTPLVYKSVYDVNDDGGAS